MGGTDVRGIAPLAGDEARDAAEHEYRRLLDVLQRLEPEQWERPTDCPAWSVRQIVAHVLGAMEGNAQPREMVRQLRRGRRGVGVEVDRVNALQVAERDHLPAETLVARYREAIPGAVAARRRMARWGGRLPFRAGAPISETWRLAYLMDVVYTRDTWMHRVDVCRATGAELVLSHAHDGRVVADVVRDWAGRHGAPFTLRLRGPAGGTFTSGEATASAAEMIDVDAVEFARMLSGRARGSGLLAVAVPF